LGEWAFCFWILGLGWFERVYSFATVGVELAVRLWYRVGLLTP
jgi:hypothetical protein